MSLPIILDTDQDEGCESVTLGVTAVTSTGSAVVDGGIHDVSAEASVRIEENDFTSAVLDSVPPEGLDVAGGLLSPATARVGGWSGGRTWCRTTRPALNTNQPNRLAQGTLSCSMIQLLNPYQTSGVTQHFRRPTSGIVN